MNALFMCNTKYSVFIAYLLKRSEYQDAYTVLVAADNVLTNEFIAHLKSSGIWDEVITISEKGQPVQSVEKQVKEIYAKTNYDKVHVFSAGKMSSHLIIKLADTKAKVILTDGSIFTKMPVLVYNNWKNRTFEQGILPDGWIDFDFDRINEVLIMGSEMFDGSLSVPVREIDFRDLWTHHGDSVLEELNGLFGFHYRYNNAEVIYCASYRAMAYYITYSYEEHFTMRLMELLQGKECLIKLHPHSNYEVQQKRFENYPVELFDYHDIPFELFFLNHISRHKAEFFILSEFSSVITNLMIFVDRLGIRNVKLVELVAIERDFNRPGVIEPYLESLNQYNELYRNSKVEIPYTWEELKNLLGGGVIEQDKTDEAEIDHEDLLFLKKDYLSLLSEINMIKNTNSAVLKFKKYYETVNELLKIKNRGDSVSRYFMEMGIRNVAIYGHGHIADRLTEDAGILINAFLLTDPKPSVDQTGIPSLSPSDFITNPMYKNLYRSTEAIVITPVSEQDSIAFNLMSIGNNKPVIMLSDIIDYLNRQAFDKASVVEENQLEENNAG